MMTEINKVAGTAASQPLVPLTRGDAAPVSQAAQPVVAGDQAQVTTRRGAVPTSDGRRERAVAMAAAMLEPPAATPETTSTFGRIGQEIERWTTPPVDVQTQVERGLRLAENSQDPRLLPSVVRIMQDGGANAERAAAVFNALLPFADAATLTQVQGSLQGAEGERLTTARSAVSATLEQRTNGVAARQSNRSGADLHWQEAGNGVVDLARDLTVGTYRQLREDPLRFPTRLIAGMGSSLHHAITNTGGAVVGLVTAGAHGSFGAQMTQELANAGTWASGFARPRRTNMHPEFAETQRLTRNGFARAMQAFDNYHANPVATQRVAGALRLPEGVGNALGRVESGVRNQLNRAWFGSEVIYADTPAHRRPGAVWKPMGWEEVRVQRGHVLGAESARLYDLFENKWESYRTIERSAPGSMPETHLARNLLQEFGMRVPRTPEARARFLGDLQTRLNERFPEGYFLKGVSDWNTGGNLPTNKTDFAATLRGYNREFVPLERRLRRQHGESADLQPHLRSHEFHAGRTLDNLLKDPTSVVIQPRLDLQRWTNRETPRHIQPFTEFRVHVVRGQVVPGASSHRWSALRTVTDRRAMGQAEAFVQGVMDQLPDRIKNRTGFAPDVVQLNDGSFRLIEMNAGGNSGFLMRNPLASHKLHEAVTGRETTPLYVARRLGASAVASAVVATHQQELPTEPRTPVAAAQ